jgi:transposase
LVRFARSVGLVRGEWVAIDGSKFQAVASARSVAEREAVKRYLDAVEAGDAEDAVEIDPQRVAAALSKLASDREPEAGFMRTAHGHAPAYNVQTAVDAGHALIVAYQVTTEKNDTQCLLPMAEAARQALGDPASLNVVADGGYSNGPQAEACEARGIVPHVPAQRAINNKGDGTLFDRSQLFHYDPQVTEEGQTLCGLHGIRGDLRRLCLEEPMHAVPTALCSGASIRRRAQAYEPACHGGGDAFATMHGRASLRHPEVPYLRTPAPAAARSGRRTD